MKYIAARKMRGWLRHGLRRMGSVSRSISQSSSHPSPLYTRRLLWEPRWSTTHDLTLSVPHILICSFGVIQTQIHQKMKMDRELLLDAHQGTDFSHVYALKRKQRKHERRRTCTNTVSSFHSGQSKHGTRNMDLWWNRQKIQLRCDTIKYD